MIDLKTAKAWVVNLSVGVAVGTDLKPCFCKGLNGEFVGFTDKDGNTYRPVLAFEKDIHGKGEECVDVSGEETLNRVGLAVLDYITTNLSEVEEDQG